MTEPADGHAPLIPDALYRVVFSRSVGLPGRVARDGVEVTASGAEIEPYRDFVLRLEEVEA